MPLRRAVVGSFLFLVSYAVHADDWTQWRGPTGQGHAVSIGYPLTWSEEQNVTWKTPVAGRGWSSPVVVANEVWMTTAVESPLTEEERKERLKGNAGDVKQLVLSGKLSLRAVCVDRTTGKLLHDVELLTEAAPDPIHALNSYASPSPVFENGRLYCHFGSNGTACLDTRTAKVLWTNQKLRLKHENGAGSTPVLWRDVLVFHCDGSDVQFIVALDKNTGEVAWKTDRSGKLNPNPQIKKAYATPLIADINGQTQLLSPGADWLYSYDPDSGRELWKLNYPAQGFSVVPRPVVGHGMIYMSTSFMQAQLLAVKYDDGKEPYIAWKHTKQVSQQPSLLLVGDEIYFVSDNGGVATCLNAKTGEELWRERLGGNFSASPLFADGRVYFSNREGVTTVVEAGKTFKPLAKNTLGGAHMASLAAADGAFFIRTDKAIYRIETPNKGR